ncbi:hypothetical protein JD844_001483 [Phrynosoma platyrhinos]|uniref:ODAD1 central coiled coil region domain-containing protein n=1 Tax=Phrynosoma platyrhinos TaxID=52577 RepID=A0ABQ7T9Z3_PHRPL|nr:hypothetical protein JD844_001483 [Phrynosoma platyrhinos]
MSDLIKVTNKIDDDDDDDDDFDFAKQNLEDHYSKSYNPSFFSFSLCNSLSLHWICVLPAEVELAKLQRQFRLLEGDRHAYNLESRETIRRQMAEVKRLQKENEDLLRRQALLESRSNLKQEKAKSDTLRSLLSQRDEIQNWQKRLADQKQIVGSGTLFQEQKAQVRRRIQTVENQLDKASKEFNSQLVVNSQLREDLEILQIEHDRFEQLYKHLESELLNARKAVGAIVSTSSAAYEARDEAQARLSQLQDKAEKDRRQYESEMKELDRLLENDRRISEFIAIKLQDRTITEEALQAQKKRDEERKRKDPDEEELESYNDVLNKVLELTGAEDLNAALDRYIKVEERNFAQFNYVNEQNNQKEQLLEQIKELRREIMEVRKQDSEKEAEQLLQLKDAEAQQEKAAQEANRMELKLKGIHKIWEQLKSGIESLFWKLQCDHSVLEKILGGTTTDRNENEQDRPYNTVEIAQLLLGQTFENRPQLVHLRPPTAGPGHDPIAEEDQRPLTHEELKNKVMKDVLSKAAALSLRKNTQTDAAHVRSGSIGTKKQLPFS